MKRVLTIAFLVAVITLTLAPLASTASADGPYAGASSSFYQSQYLRGSGSQTQVFSNSSVYYSGYGYTYGTTNTFGLQNQNIYWGTGSQSQGFTSTYYSRGRSFPRYGW